MEIIITANDFYPGVIPIWKQTWDKLHNEHPELKVTAFTIPMWGGISANDIFKNRSFKQWYTQRKSWVEVQQTGYEYSKTAECKKFKKPQYALIRRGQRKILKYAPKNYHVFKSPRDEMNYNTISILKELGYKACIRYKQVIMLQKTENILPEYSLIETHININEKYPDDIQKISNKIGSMIDIYQTKKYPLLTISQLIKKTEKKTENDDVEKIT
ncbi:MAG: hypothetical protein Q8O68_00720 [Candidatus Daviesbacteria bacterium]|nr:hypothetical protein [Candidatus Daviesbacteria bacterium]